MTAEDLPHGTPISHAVSADAPARPVDVPHALDASGMAAWRWERGDSAIGWTPGAAEILGVPDLILRSPELLVRAIAGENFALISHALERARDSGGTFSARLPIELGTSLRWYDIAGRVLVGEAGAVIGATGTATEVTDRREADEAILSTLDDAERALEHLLALVWRWSPTSGLLTIIRQPNGLTLVDDVPDDMEFAAVVARMGEHFGSQFRDALAMCWFDGRPITLDSFIRDDDHRDRRVLLRARPAAPGDYFEVVGVLLD